MASIRAGTIYFALVFAIGFVFGTVRQLLLVPYLGDLKSIAVEAPLMVAASYLVARSVIRRLEVPREIGPRLQMGLTALTLLIVVEAVSSQVLRGWTFEQWLAHFATAQGLLSLVLFLFFAAMPLILLRKPL
jgi:hypothetical protein